MHIYKYQLDLYVYVQVGRISHEKPYESSFLIIDLFLVENRHWSPLVQTCLQALALWPILRVFTSLHLTERIDSIT